MQSYDRRIEEYFLRCSPLEDSQDSPIEPGNLSAENEDDVGFAFTNPANIVNESSPGSPV